MTLNLPWDMEELFLLPPGLIGCREGRVGVAGAGRLGAGVEQWVGVVVILGVENTIEEAGPEDLVSSETELASTSSLEAASNRAARLVW